MKTCRKCKEEFPATVEFWTKDKRRKNGIAGPCKKCVAAYQAKYRKTDARKVALKKYNSSEKGKATTKKYLSSEKGKKMVKDRKASGRTQELNRKATKKYRTTAKGKEASRQGAARYRAKLLKVEREKFSPQDVLDRWGADCHICEKPVDLGNWEMEHVYPISKGGSHTLKNVKPAHPVCNKQKGNKV